MRGRFNRHKQERSWVVRYEVLELANNQNWVEREMFWIAYGRKMGWPLENKSIGGEGSHGYIVPESWRRKMSKIMRGRRLTQEHKDKLKAAWVIRKRTVGSALTHEGRARIVAANKGKVISIRHRRILARLHKGTHLSKEIRLKISQAHAGKPKSDKHRAAVSAGMKGLKQTKEHIKNKVASRLKNKQRKLCLTL